MEQKIYTLKLTTTEPLLGTQPQKEVATEFTKGKAIDAGMEIADELETLPEMLEKGTTAFHKSNGAPVYFDYMIKGFLKETASVFNSIGTVKALRSKVENYMFVQPRMIPLRLPNGDAITFLERPLRAQTAQGPRTSLARSEMLPAGTWLECRLLVLSPTVLSEKLVRELLDYGALRGIGQWRNGGYGRFVYELDAQ